MVTPQQLKNNNMQRAKNHRNNTLKNLKTEITKG